MAVDGAVHDGLRLQARARPPGTTRIAEFPCAVGRRRPILPIPIGGAFTLLFIIEHLTIGRPAGTEPIRTLPVACVRMRQNAWTS